MIDALVLLLLIGFVAGAWTWSTAGRERVVAVVKEVCADLKLQRLDDSVVLRGLRLLRTPRGITLGRVYRFEFTIDGISRYAGDVALAGDALAWIRFGHPDGDIHIDLESR